MPIHQTMCRGHIVWPRLATDNNMGVRRILEAKRSCALASAAAIVLQGGREENLQLKKAV